MDANMKRPPSVEDANRAERIRMVLEALVEINRRVPVIVEGKKDATALRNLGLSGEVLALHNGKGMYEFCEDLMDRYSKVVLLTDWDTRGEELHRALASHLGGLYEEFSDIRALMKILCQKDIKDIEGIPKLLGRLEAAYPLE